MIPQREVSDFSISEWYRLDNIASTYDRELKTAWLRTVAQRQQANSLHVRNIFTDCVVETAVTTAHVYGLVFNPNSPIWRRLIDRLTDNYMGVVENDSVKDKVREILPTGLSLSDRRDRLDTFGLDERSAIRIERMRQAGNPELAIKQARLHMSLQRGNIISLTEINRVINRTIETLCIDNFRVTKAVQDDFSDIWFFEDSVPSNITSIAGLPKRAKKEIITRRDDRVCNYCDPLDGMKVKIGEMFDTDYGYFLSPPFHPRCRCFLGVSL